MAEEPVWKRGRSLQKKSRAQEQRMAKEKGGKPQINSGRFWFSKRDSKKFVFLVENRLVVTAKSYTIKGEELKKLTKDAFFHNNLPAMQIEFEQLREDWILIRRVDFEELYGTILELQAVIESMEK